MKSTNPWLRLDGPPYVLDDDRAVVDAFNASVGEGSAFRVRTNLFPEPFIGNLDAPVLLLALNPGYSPEDDAWHRKPVFANAIRDNLAQRSGAYPFYFFNPELRDSPGARWWLQKCRQPGQALGFDVLSRSLCCVELFPYHSERYKAMPKSIAPRGLPPSAEFGIQLVRSAIQDGKLIIGMRSHKLWCESIPELADYSRLLRLRNPQNVTISPGNMDGYAQFLSEISG